VCRPFTIDFLVIIIIISLSAYSIIMPSLITPLLGLFVIFTIITGARKKRVGGGGQREVLFWALKRTTEACLKC
jgi:hypothetical protein